MVERFKVYKGTGELGAFREVSSINDTQGYKPSKELINAVNVAILLGKPLLVTGEPGTGKTLLAKSIANEITSNGKELEYLDFTAKTTSRARDLLYRYDSIGHLRKANLAKNNGQEKVVEAKSELERLKKEYDGFIKLEAMGEAIRLAQEEKRRSVVLIDEIDKAPRDFPNDILREIENMSFKVLETGETYESPTEFKPIIIITSNSERLLPDAFLRRCVFFHIEFPEKDLLKEIALGRLSTYLEGDETKQLRFGDAEVNWLLDHFYEIRDLCRKKKPATAEFLSWLQILDKYEFNAPSNKESKAEELNDEEKDLLLLSYAILAKHEKDIELLKNHFKLGQNNG